MTLPEQKLYIGGRYVDATSGERFETINPATGEVICSVQQAGAEDVQRAVESAQQGFEIWSAMSGAERGRILMKAVWKTRNWNMPTG